MRRHPFLPLLCSMWVAAMPSTLPSSRLEPLAGHLEGSLRISCVCGEPTARPTDHSDGWRQEPSVRGSPVTQQLLRFLRRSLSAIRCHIEIRGSWRR
jgi:hypothetical protein